MSNNRQIELPLGLDGQLTDEGEGEVITEIFFASVDLAAFKQDNTKEKKRFVGKVILFVEELANFLLIIQALLSLLSKWDLICLMY